MNNVWYFVLLVVLGLLLTFSSTSQTELTNANSTTETVNTLQFARKLLEEYGHNGLLNVTQLSELIQTIKKASDGTVTVEKQPEKLDHVDRTSQLKVNDSGNASLITNCSEGITGYPQCLSTANVCMSAGDIFNLHGLSHEAGANASQVVSISPTILYNLQKPSCRVTTSQGNVVRHKPTPGEVWGYSLLCVTLINLCSLLGMVFIPFMSKPFYNHILLFMVALAVGTLAGSSLLFLIPESFELTGEESHIGGVYMWRATTVMAGIYMFFLTERILKIITDWKQGCIYN